MNKQIQKLIRFNKIMAGLHFAQAVIILLISNDFTLPISTSYQVFNQDTMTLELATRVLRECRLANIVAAFLFISSLAHVYVAYLRPKWYASNLKKGINKARWWEYSISASIMMVGIAMLAGVEDLSSLIMIFSLVAIMNLMGLAMEVLNQGSKKVNWLTFNVGVLAGIIPWLVVAIYFWGASSVAEGQIPTFVYWIFVTIFAFFNIFAINMILQYKKIGPWKDYLYGEKVYVILSLVAKSALAWQVFAGTLRPM